MTRDKSQERRVTYTWTAMRWVRLSEKYSDNVAATDDACPGCQLCHGTGGGIMLPRPCSLRQGRDSVIFMSMATFFPPKIPTGRHTRYLPGGIPWNFYRLLSFTPAVIEQNMSHRSGLKMASFQRRKKNPSLGGLGTEVLMHKRQHRFIHDAFEGGVLGCLSRGSHTLVQPQHLNYKC